MSLIPNALRTVLPLAAAAGLTLLPAAPAAAQTPPADGPVLVITKVKRPWYAADFLVERGFRKSVPEYAALPGLLTKFYTLAEDGRFGGVYLLSDRASAERQFDTSWHSRVQARYGAPGEVRMYTVLGVLDRRSLAERAAVTRDDAEGVLSLLDAATAAALPDDADGLRWRARLRDAQGRRVDAVLWTRGPVAAGALHDPRGGGGSLAALIGYDVPVETTQCAPVQGQCAIEYFRVPVMVQGRQALAEVRQ
jgi:hypothetical protein